MSLLKKEITDGVIHLSGVIHERTSLIELVTEKPPLSLNLQKITGINSQGVLGFTEFVRQLGDAEVTFIGCSTPLVDAICLVPAMLGNPPNLSRLRSFFVDYKCEGCSEEFEALVNILSVPNMPKALEALPCPHCVSSSYPINEPESIFLYLYPEA